MKKKATKNIVRYKADKLPKDSKTDWERVDAMTDHELKENAASDEDTLWADKKFWQMAQLLMPEAQGKERITFRIDIDTLQWLKQQGKGYQSRMNSILHGFMIAVKGHSHEPKAKPQIAKHHADRH